MSIWARHWALAQIVDGEGSSRAARRCVLLDLADWMIGDDATECYPTIETLAFDTGFNRQTVMKALAALVEQGLVARRYEWDGLKKYAYYRFVGYVPKEWQGSMRPDAANPEGPRFKTSGNTDVRNPEGTKSRTTEGTKSHTTQGTKSRTHGGTKSRTVTGNIHGITRNSHGVGSAHAETTCLDTNPNLEDVPFPDFEEPTHEELFVIVDAPEPNAEAKPKAKRTRAAPKTRCPFDERKPVLPTDWLTEFEEDFPSLDVPDEFKKFVGFHVSKGNVFADWKSAFRNWLHRALKFQARDAARSGVAARPTSNFKRALQREDMVYTDDF